MSGDMVTDTKNKVIPGFAPTRIQAVTTAAWTPGDDDRAFATTVYCTYQINGTGEVAILQEGSIRVIVPDQTYTFSVGQNLEVM